MYIYPDTANISGILSNADFVASVVSAYMSYVFHIPYLLWYVNEVNTNAIVSDLWIIPYYLTHNKDYNVFDPHLRITQRSEGKIEFDHINEFNVINLARGIYQGSFGVS